MARGGALGRASALGMAGVPSRGVAESVPGARLVASGPAVSLSQQFASVSG